MPNLINGKTPEEIKRGIEWAAFECDDQFCDDCKFAQDCHTFLSYKVAQDALALIAQLEAERDAALAKVTKWISVEERLPEAEERVLVYAVGDYPGFEGETAMEITDMYYSPVMQKKYWRSPWEYFLTDYKITHWMPRPEPPEEVV